MRPLNMTSWIATKITLKLVNLLIPKIWHFHSNDDDSSCGLLGYELHNLQTTWLTGVIMQKTTILVIPVGWPLGKDDNFLMKPWKSNHTSQAVSRFTSPAYPIPHTCHNMGILQVVYWGSFTLPNKEHLHILSTLST